MTVLGWIVVLGLVAAFLYALYVMEVRPIDLGNGQTFYPWTGQTKITDLPKFLRWATIPPRLRAEPAPQETGERTNG